MPLLWCCCCRSCWRQLASWHPSCEFIYKAAFAVKLPSCWITSRQIFGKYFDNRFYPHLQNMEDWSFWCSGESPGKATFVHIKAPIQRRRRSILTLRNQNIKQTQQNPQSWKPPPKIIIINKHVESIRVLWQQRRNVVAESVNLTCRLSCLAIQVKPGEKPAARKDGGVGKKNRKGEG